MTLSSLSKNDLLARFTKLVRTERKITHLVLECIAEIDRRQLHLEMAYPSLFEYLTGAHGYSAAAAQRRISAARLLREVPEVAAKIEEGKLNLSQIALVTQNIREAEKTFETKMDAGDKLELIEKIESRSFAETQQILARELKVEAPATERVQHHGDGSVTITMTLTEEQYRDWCRAGELASHSVPNRKHAELAGYLAGKEIARRTEIRRVSPRRASRSSNPRQIAPNLRKRLLGGAPVRGPTSPTGRKAILVQESTSDSAVDSAAGAIGASPSTPGCSYIDPLTGRRCGSQHLLQIDHIRPVYAGGGNEAENLRALCAAHNRHTAKINLRMNHVKVDDGSEGLRLK